VVVADAWQGRGVGSALTRALVTRARARGVASATMDVLHGNRQVLAMIAAHWPAARVTRSPECTTIRATLAPLASSSGTRRPAGCQARHRRACVRCVVIAC
jgi:GNAT superfamily N-acetyltransferase